MSFKQAFVLVALAVGIAASADSAHAQVSPTTKIVVIDTSVFFNEKSGITRIVTAAKNLSNELAVRRNEVQTLVARIDTLNKEIETFRGNAAKGIPVDEKTFQTKVDEVERLKREGKFKEDEFNAHAQKRQNEVVGPAYSDALKVLGEYVKTKDYGILFDASKDQGGLLIYASEKYDITKEFIAFYNARPVTSIAPVPR